MNLKRILLCAFVFALMLPFVVKAKNTCGNNIVIRNVELTDSVGNAEETNDVLFEGNQIKMDLLLHDPGDSIDYVLEITNNSDEAYYINKNLLKSNSDYISYSIDYGDSNKIDSGQTRSVILTVTYENRAPQNVLNPDGSLEDRGKTAISLSTDYSIINPNTADKLILLIIFVLLMSILGYVYFKKQKNVKKYISVAVCLSFIIPSIVLALCEEKINLEINVMIDGKEAHFINGASLNMKMKTLAGLDTSGMNVFSFGDGNSFPMDQHITALNYSLEEPIEANKQEANLVSTDDSPYPIYMWYDNGTIYWWSEDTTPSLNKDSKYLFLTMVALQDTSGIKTFDASQVEDFSFSMAYSIRTDLYDFANWNVSNVVNATGMFVANPRLENLDGLEHWNVSKLKNASDMFSESQSLLNVDALADWDTSSLEDVSFMFFEDVKLNNIDGMANWDMSNVTNMKHMFGYAKELEDISGLTDWDTSSVEDMSYVFYFNSALADYSPLANWDVSMVKDMSGTFYHNDSLTNLDAISEWNTSNVENLMRTFGYNENMIDINGVANWNVSNVKNMSWTFSYDTALTNVDALADWNTSSAEDISLMFFWDLSLTSVEGVKNWDVRNVKTMHQIFCSDIALEEIDLSNWETPSLEIVSNMFAVWDNYGAPWDAGTLKRVILSDKFDTSHVNNMSMMFANQSMIEDYSFLELFDTSNVTNLSMMFQGNSGFNNLEYVRNWDVSSATNVSHMFAGIGDITDASAINDWDVRNVTNFSYMFSGSSVYPEFTLVPGTWNNGGTFTPSN